MNVETVYAKVLDRLNKGSSNNQKVSKRQFVYAFNKMQLHWFEQRVKLEEVDKIRQEELQQFIEEIKKTAIKKDNYSYIDFPENYFHYKRVFGLGKKGSCEGIIYAFPIEESLVNRYLNDEFTQPSFSWQETFFTPVNNKIRFYHNDDFSVSEISLIYYRCPKEIDMEGITHIEKEGINIDPELTKVNLEEVIDLTVRLLSGDIMDMGRFQITSQRINEFN